MAQAIFTKSGMLKMEHFHQVGNLMGAETGYCIKSCGGLCITHRDDKTRVEVQELIESVIGENVVSEIGINNINVGCKRGTSREQRRLALEVIEEVIFYWQIH